jgi:subtilisin-like proprotein convertase family protein
LIAALLCAIAVSVGPSQAGAATFSNPGAITINDAATASPYPSTISVTGVGASVVDVNGTLSGFSHTFPADVDVMLVGPQGQSVVLMSDVPRDDPVCGSDAAGLVLTFDDAAPGPIPLDSALASGTFRPTNNETYVTNCAPAPDVDAFPVPAPSSPYGSTLAVYNGTDPNGTWSLYVLDDGGGDSGSIGNGWSLDITAPPPPSGPPDTTITRFKVKHKARKASFSFTGSGGSGALSFECKLDKRSFRVCTSPEGYQHLRPGKHTFAVRAVDAVAQADPTPASQIFRIHKVRHKGHRRIHS